MTMFGVMAAGVLIWAWWCPADVGEWVAKARHAYDQTKARGGKDRD